MTPEPEHFLSNFLISIRERLRSGDISREGALWHLTTAMLTMEAAIAGLIEDRQEETGSNDLPGGWPPDER